MPEDVKFSISLPDGRQTEWDQKQYNKGANTLFEKYPDAQVNRISGYSEQSDLTPDSSFHITLDDGRETDWNYDQFSKGRETLLKKYPNAKISVTDDITAQRNRDFAHQYEFAQSKVDDINMPDSEKQPYIDFVGQHAERYDKVKDKYGNQYNGRPDGSDRLVEIYSRMEALQKELEGLPQERDYRGLSREEAVLYAQEANSPEGRRRSEIKKELEQLRKERETNPAWQAYWNKTEEDLPGLIDAMDAKAKEYANVGGRSANMSDQEALDLIGGAEEKQGNEQERDYYLTARKYYKEALETAKAPSKYDDSWGIVNFAKGAGANIASAISILELAKSLQDVNLINTVKQIQQAEGKDVNLIDLVNNESDKLNYLSDGQKEMLKAFAKRYEVEQGRSDNMSIGYNAGKGAITSLGFMGDFLVTGGLGEAAGKAVAKKLAKTTTEEIAGKTLGAQTKKLLVGNLEGATKALVMTPMMPSSYANFINNLTQLNADGQMDLSAKAVGKAIEDGLIETFSENAGELFGIPFEGKIFEGIAKSKLGEVGKAMSRTGAGQFLKQAGWHGLVGEMAEEVLGNAMRSALNVDENALKDFFSGDQFWTTLASFAPMSIVGAGSSAIQIRKAGRQMTKYGDQLKTILNNLGLNEDQMEEVEFSLDLSEVETPEELGSSIARVGRLVGKTGLLTQDIAPDLGMAMGQYLQAAAQYKVLRGIFDEEQDIARAQNSALLDEQVGYKSWYHEGEDGANYVRTITDAEGNERFVVNSLDGQYALIGKDGSYSFLTNEELEAGIADGSLTDSGEQPINSYLDGIAENEQRTSEQERMAEETASQISAIQQRIAADPTINMGTEESPKMAVVDASNAEGVHVTWQDEDGAKDATLTWEQVGNYLGTPVEVKTDEQIEEEEVQAEEDIQSRKEDYNKTIPMDTEFTAVLVEGEEPVTYQFKRAFINEDGTMMLQVTDKETGKDEQITEEMALQGNLTSVLDSFKTPAEVQQEEVVAEEETPVDDGILRDFRGNPIPLKDDGSVNQTALWNADPEAWAKWNDSQRNDGGANSRGYIAKATKKLQSDAKAVQKQIAKELDFDKIESLEGQLASINNRIADLERIENNYANAEVAQTEVEQTPEEVPAPVAPVAEVAEEAPVAETVPEVQEEQVPLTPDQVLEGRLAEAKTPEEKRQALEEYYALTTTDPTVVGTRADILQRMTELGFSERVIGQVRDQLNDKGELTEGFHIGSMVFIVADDIRDARRARLAHLHEHWHEINMEQGYHGMVASMPGVTVESLLNTANKLAGITTGKGYADYLNYPNPRQALADEVIALSMEVVAESTPENVDENLRNAGLDNQEIINFVKTIYNGERGNDQTLDSSGRDTLSGDNAQEGERQDGGDSASQPEGILGEQGSGSEEGSIQGAGEGGLDTSGDREVAQEGITSITDAAKQDNGGINFSIRTEDSVEKKIRDFAKSEEGKKLGWTEPQIEGIINETADLMRAIHASLTGDKYYDEWAKKDPTVKVDWRDGVEKPTVTWSRANIEYKYDMSADLLCINNEGLEEVLASPTMVDLMLKMNETTPEGFTSDDYLRLYETLRDMGFVVPCKGCFDAAMRLKMLPSVSRKFVALVNKTIDERNKDPQKFDEELRASAGENATLSGLPSSAKNKEEAIRIGVAGDNLTEHVSFTQLMSAEGQTKALSDWGGIFRAWQRTGAGRPKDKLLPEPWTGDIVSTTTTIIGKYGEKTPSYRDINVNQGTGLRRNSHSEFRPLLAIDEIQFMREAFIRNLTVFKYMKELDDVRLFGKLGVKFNMSFFPAFVEGAPAAGLDANGDYIAAEESVGGREFEYTGEDGKTHYDGMKGWQEAQKHVNKDVSLSSVIFSIPHLIKAFTDVPTKSNWKGLWGSLIPFHASGATKGQLKRQGLGEARAIGVGHGFEEALTDYGKGVTNFEAVQNDRFGEGWEIVDGMKAGTAVEPGHKLEFANGTHYYNQSLGVHLFSSFYILDSEIKPEHLDKKGKLVPSKAKEAGHPFSIDYNDKVREIGTNTAYQDAADYYVETLRNIGLIPRFDFTVPEETFLKMCEDAHVDPTHPKIGWKGEGHDWSPVDSEAYYSLWCDYGMIDPETGDIAPHNPVGMIDENGNRVFKLPDNAVEIIKDGVKRYGERKDRETQRTLEAIEEFAKRSIADGKLRQEDADAIITEAKEEQAKQERQADAQKFVMDFINGNVSPIEMANATQKQPISEATKPVVTEEDVMFRLSKNNKATVESWLKKREDINDEQRAEVVDYIDKLDDAKTQLATAKWFANGTIRIPEDMKKVQQAISVAGKAKVDPLRYNSPMELLDAHAEFKPSEERINPDEVSTLHRAAEYPDGIVVYDVDNTKESRENMRKIINTHFGKDASPWCLLQGDGKGNLTADSARYWKHYNAYPKQVAFKDGKLLAFSANDTHTRVWWDRQDQSHYGIPITKKVEGDELGRTADHIFQENAELGRAKADQEKLERELAVKYSCPPYRLWELASEEDKARLETAKEKVNEAYINGGEPGWIVEPGGHMYRGNKQNGVYEEWNSAGDQLLLRTEYKDGKENGVTEQWYPSGQLWKRAVMKDDGYAGPYEMWYENGQQKMRVEMNERGEKDGEQVGWYKNGNRQHEGRYSDGHYVGDRIDYYESGEPKSIIHYDETGGMTGFEDYVIWRGEKGVKAHVGLGRRVAYAPGDSNRRTEEEFRANGKLHKREEYHGSKLDGIAEYYYPDGTLQSRTHFVEGERNGTKEIYHENGKLWLRGDFKDGEVDGLQEQWNKEGDLILREEWKNGEKVRTLPLDENVQFRKVEPIVDEKSEALFEQAKKTFGTTNNLAEAGYVIPDGSMLDFSGRHLLDPGQDSSWMNGMRQVDHREISDLNYEKDGNTPSGYETDMRDFIRRGAIRLNSGVINLATKPTKGQENVLWGLIQRANGDVDVDFGDGYDSDHYASYNHARPERILNDIRRYFDEGIEPEGNVMFRKANQTQNGFISNAEAALDKIKMDKATPEQWVKMLEKEGGLKAGEDKWLGLSDWLKASDKKTITKDEIADFIEQNRIQIEEVRYSEEAIGQQKNDAEEALERYREEYENFAYDYREGEVEYSYNWPSADDYAFDQMVEKYGDDFRMAFQIGTMGQLEPIEGIDDDYSDAAKYFLGIEETSEARPIDSVRLGYTTSGLTNKAEIALTVPTVDPWNESDRIHFGDAGEGRAVAWIRFGETTTNMTGTGYAPRNIMDDLEQRYGNSRAFDIMTDEDVARAYFADYIYRGERADKGVIEFSMTNELGEERKQRVYPIFEGLVGNNKEGQRVLVLDEIQSKRHQEGREKGYIGKENVEELEQKWRDASKAYDDYVDSLREKYEGFNWIATSLTDEEDKKVQELNEASVKAAEAVDKAKVGVPAAPFEKNWHELAMKRMLRLAAEEGYDKIAWTTGDQQAERYNIGNTIESIAIHDHKWGRMVDLLPKDSGTITLDLDKDGKVTQASLDEFEGKTLEEIVGKGLAEKIMSAKNGEEISGEGLRVGGEGMRGFYDDILPRFMNKYGKKWGVKVQDIELPEVYDEIGHPLVMHSVDVTPEMRESVMEGQVMFRKAITPEQDKDYMAAVEAGDMDKAQQMVREAAALAMPDTKVLDEDGRPEVVYHGSYKKGITKFNDEHKWSDSPRGTYWFTNKKAHAETYQQDGGDLLNVFLNIKNPLIIGAEGMSWDQLPAYYEVYSDKDGVEIDEQFDTYAEALVFTKEKGISEKSIIAQGEMDTNAWAKRAKEKGYDGLIVKRVSDIYDTLGENVSREDEIADDYVVFAPNQIKSAEPVTYDANGEVIPLSERFNEESDDIRFSLRGIIGAENAEDEVALDNLEVAEEMENAGKDSQTIWKATGWERGVDGKWRNEIPDAKLKEGVSLEEYNTAQDVIDAPDLFKSYPDLLFTTIQIKKIKGTVAGSFAPKDNRITIDSSDTKKVDGKTILTDEGLKTLVHEFQHAIQHIEGFAKGGSGKTVERNYYKGSMKSHPEETLFAWLISRYQNSKVIMMLGKQRIINAMEKYDDSNLNNSEKKVFSNILDRLRGMDETQFRSFVLDASQIAKKAKSAGKEGYYKLAGEVESRNVELRSKLSEEGRRNTAPSLTAEVEEANQIVMFRKRTKEDPKETIKVYKLMRLEDGKKLPLFIDRNSEPLEDGQWYDADSPDLAFLKEMPSGIFLVDADNGTYTSLKDYQKERGAKATKWPTIEDVNEASSKGLRWMKITDTEKGQKRYEGENRKYENIGINGSDGVSTFAMRPGWHAGSLPTMRQIGKGAEKNIRDDNFVWVEGEIPADIDYNEEAQRNPDKDIPTHIPTDGFYMKATNADKAKSQADRVGWYVAGAFKPNRVIGDLEARQIIDDWNAEHPEAKVEYDWPREGGRIFNADTMQLEDDSALFRLNQDAVQQSREGGLTGVIGDENAAELYRNVYKAVPKEIRQQIVDKAGDGYLFSEATKDMISEAVEKGDKTGIAGLAANMLRDYAGPLDERTARYILWRGDRKVEDDDLLDTVNDIAMQRRLKVGRFAEQPMFRRSPITPEQDKEYMEAVDKMRDHSLPIEEHRKAVAKVKSMISDAFMMKRGTELVDEKENPIVMWHTTQDEFTVFDKSKLGKYTDHSASNENYAKTSHIGFWSNIKSDLRDKMGFSLGDESMPLFIETHNPLRFESLADLANELGLYETGEDFANEKKSQGYDSVIINDEEFGGISCAVFNANQLKSAALVTYDDNGKVVPLSERFNPDSEDIRFRLGEEIDEAEHRAESMADDAKATLNEKKEFAKVNDALTTIKAMSLQKEYDRKTVNTITVLAKNVLKDQSIETLSRHEIARLLGIVTTSIGKAPKTVKKNADALIDMILGHMLKSEETKLGMLASVRATKTNTTGVEVQGELDVRGQNVLKAYKAGLNMDLENSTDEYDENTIKGRLAVLNDRQESTDDAVRSEAEDEIAGLMLAQEYQEKVKASINEERGIKNEMKDAAEQLRDGKISRTAYNEFVTEAENSIRENRIERIEAYQSLRAKMVSMMAGSIDARKEFTEREKQRVEEIHHLANSDMQGEDASPFKESTRMGRFVNSSIVRFLSKPLVTFDQMLRLFGQKNVAGEGYLWNKFHRGWIEANENAFLGEKEAKSELDEKVSEVFERDMRWSDLYAEERKMPKVKVKWWDGGEMKEHELTQGNLLYIYMVNKMTDGRMKLRRMGITQGIVDAIKKQMDIRFLELADWVQEKFLVEKRNKYNAVHERLFGASMAAIEDYFPLKINKRSLNKAEDIGRPDFDDALPATTTGSIIKRKRNAQDLDLLGADAFSVVIEHIEQMEQWAAFAEFNKDLNTLLSYKRFRNQVQNMVSVYGSGRELWNNFKAVSRIVGGTYSPAGKKSDLDTAALNVAKGVTSAKISFRVYTALKQLLSMPAFIADANIKHFGENLATPWKAWNWAMENLPMFEKRWKSRMAGDTRLMNTDSDWKFFRSQVYDTLSRLGMSPNAFVDAMTVSIGAHSIYQTRYDRYINDGYSEEEADKKAKQDATTLYNETQQSNEGAFVAPVQLDRTVLATMITVFRNSSMGYQRQLHDALRNIGKMMKPGYRAASIEFMKKQMERDGLTEEQAEHAANRNYEREKWRSAARVATFGFLVQFAWNLGGSIAYLLFGDDDDKKEEMLTEALIHGLIGGTMEGLAGGNVMSEALNMVAKGESLNNYDPSLLPIISDIKSAYKKMSYDPVAGSNDLINLAIQAGIGVNPQTLTDAVVAVVDACGGDLETSTEAMLLLMRVLQVPQSQVDQIYIDELGMNADKARTMSPGEMAERYARYKVAKGAPLTGWAYSDEAEEKREKAYLKRFKKLVNERKSK